MKKSPKVKPCLTCDWYSHGSVPGLGGDGICYCGNPRFKKDGSCTGWKPKKK